MNDSRVSHRPLIFAAAGLATMAVAFSVPIVAARAGSPAGRPTAAAPSGISTERRGDADANPRVSIADLTYEPGHSSGWHIHYGLHSVVVLSGTLTVYDERCQRVDFGPGETYLGGSEPHLARNEADESLGLAVTYVSASSPSTQIGAKVAPPSGCELL